MDSKKPKFKVKICTLCGEKYTGHIAQKWCTKCKALKLEAEKKTVLVLVCPFCDVTFKTVKTNKKFCCDAHKRKYHIQEYHKNKHKFKDLTVEDQDE